MVQPEQPKTMKLTEAQNEADYMVAQGKTVECGWDHMFRSLRKKLAMPKRLFA